MDKIISYIPASAIIPTANREAVLLNTFRSIAQQVKQPVEIIVIDASDTNETFEVCNKAIDGLIAKIIYRKAETKGAAIQREQGIKIATQPFIFFMDDDIILHEGCIEKLWNCVSDRPEAGGANALVINQQYHNPGKVSSFMYRLMNGKKLDSYAGKCIGPAWNLLPQDTGPLVNEVEWLYTTCTLYRKEALPNPLFPTHFKGYSLMEDLALSLTVGKKWKLYNVRDAKIFHDSQPGTHKNSVFKTSKMELVNRHFIMVSVLGRTGFSYHLKLFIFELWGIVSMLGNLNGWKKLFPGLMGKFAALYSLLEKRNEPDA